MGKFPDAYELLKEHVKICKPIALTRTDIERTHDPAYLDAVSFDDQSGPPQGLTQYDRNRLGLPANPRLLERSMLETAGTVSATLAALDDGIAANLAGGTHHAFPNRGLGFCVLNDIAVAVEYLRAIGKCADQILIVDTDAHQGNANNAYFRGDDRVFTYSIHVGRNYPAHKEPGDCDVPLPRWADSATYLVALKETLPTVFRKTEPDLVFWITGADIHADDRFGQMKLTHAAIAERDQFVLSLFQKYACAACLVYGGGYNRTLGETGRIHAETILRAVSLGQN